MRINKSFNIANEGVLITNDTFHMGLLPLFAKYSMLLVENAISMRSATINSRIVTMISASDERTKQSAEIYIKKIENGSNTIIGENPFFDGVKAQSGMLANSRLIEQLIELHQYLKASFFNEIGLDA